MSEITTTAAGGTVRHAATSSDGAPLCWTELGSGYPILVCSPAAMPFWYWEPLLRSLTDRFRLIFVHPRGLWANPLPADLRAVTVADHARDVAFVVDALSLRGYGMVGHCIGVTPIVASLASLPHRPDRVVLVSTRFGPGTVINNLDNVVEKARGDERFRRQFAKVAAAYAPPALRAEIERQLGDMREFEAHLRVLQSVRAYDYAQDWPGDVPALLVMSTGDSDAIRTSTRDYARKLGDCCTGVLELDGGHCAMQEDRDAGRRVVTDAFATSGGAAPSRAT